MTRPPQSMDVVLVVSMLALDALAVRVVRTLESKGVDVLLMKGPVTSQWLFDDPLVHVYTDVDLLVGPESMDTASAVLAGELGCRDLNAGILGVYRPTHETAWASPEGVIDLHQGLAGIPELCRYDGWEVFWRERERFDLHGHSVTVLGRRARVLQLALHAAPRRGGNKPLTDLATALAVLEPADWRAAADLADQLEAIPAFSAALNRLEAGRRVWSDLQRKRSYTTASVLSERGSGPEAVALERLGSMPASERGARLRSWLSAERGETQTNQPSIALARLKVAGRLPLGIAQWLQARREARRKSRRAARGRG